MLLKIKCVLNPSIKSITARKIFKEYSEIGKKLWGVELWSDGYYTGTFGYFTTFGIIKNYVENQEEKEAERIIKIFDFE
jgi:putative transposase